MPDRIYLSPPHLNGSEQDFLNATLESNWIAPIGPNVDAWRKELADYLKIENVWLTNSGTAAVHLALKALGVGKGDIVLVQSHNHIGSVNPIVYQGAEPVFIDSEPSTWNMDPKLLDKAIEELGADKIKAILIVHIYGMPAKMDSLLEIAQKHAIPVVEDAAESLGSTYNNRFTGTLGDIGIFSFNGNKILTTGGGGAIVSSNKGFIDKAQFWSNQAREEEIHFEHREVGHNYTMSNVLAAIGRGQMKNLNDRIKARRNNFDRYRKIFENWNSEGFNIEFQEETAQLRSNRWLSSIVIDPKKNKGLTSGIIRNCLENENIESRPLWKGMHLQPVFKSARSYGGEVCQRLYEHGICLPSGSNLTESDWSRIEKALDLAKMNQHKSI